jgi:microsomal dipeptidase-like Zn-dependent dipeptidase
VITDLHAHYPMHVVREVTPRTTVELMRSLGGRPTLRDKLRALVLHAATRLLSDSDWWSGYRISVPYLREGRVGVVFSVLYRPFEEMDLSKPYAAPPAPAYFPALMSDLDDVEREVAGHDPAVIRHVKTREQLDRCVEDGAIALVHCVEGGFHLGDGEAEIAENVATLAGRGVAYITIAHLFYRQVAVNANALPFLPGDVYDRVFPQPDAPPLTPRAEAAIRAMVAHRVMVDVSHMRPDAVTATCRLLDELDPDRSLPVLSTHAGFRFGDQDYMHDEEAVDLIRRRDGVIGLILAQHQLNDGLRSRRRPTKTLAESMPIVFEHVERIAKVTGDHRHVAIGSDLDGFIKPTIGGVKDMRSMAALERALRDQYGADAALITSENALRVLRRAWA